MTSEQNEQNELHLDVKQKAELSVKLDSIISRMKIEAAKLEQQKKISESLVNA